MSFGSLGRLLSLGRGLVRRSSGRTRYSIPDHQQGSFVPRVTAFEQHPLTGEFLKDLRVNGGDLESRGKKPTHRGR